MISENFYVRGDGTVCYTNTVYIFHLFDLLCNQLIVGKYLGDSVLSTFLMSFWRTCSKKMDLRLKKLVYAASKLRIGQGS